MKYSVIVVFAIVLTSCFPTGTTETMEEEVIELKNTKWKLADNYKLDAYIEFDDEINHISGNNGCNQFSADIVKKNYHIELTNFSATEKYCDQLDDKDKQFLIALSKVQDYRLTPKNLILDTRGELVRVGSKKTRTILLTKVKE